MQTVPHKKVPFNQSHAPHSFEYTDRAERISKKPADFQAWEINRLALQKDNNSYQRLSQITPTVKQTPVHGSSMFQILQSDNVTNIEYSTTPGNEGNVVKTTYESGYEANITYNSNKKVEYITYTRTSDNKVVEKQKYTYDASGRITQTQQVV